MKNSFLKAVAICMFCTFITSSVSAQNPEELKTRITKINKEMQQAMLSGNISAGLAYYTQDAISLPNYSKMAQGLEAIKKLNEEMMTSGMKITSFETNTLTVSTCENNIAEIGTYTMGFTMTGMSGTMTDVGKYLTIWEKQGDGSLKIKFEMWNTDSFPMMGN